jgi:hypothetical protein
MRWLMAAGILAVLLCCGGGILVALYFGGQAKGLSDDAGKFGDESLVAIATNWDEKALLERAAPELAEKKDEVSRTVAVLRDALGKMKSDKSTLSGLSVKADGGGSRSEAEYKADCVFEKGKGEVRMRLLKRGPNWSIAWFSGKAL